MKKAKIRIEKIYRNKVKTKYGEKDTFVLRYKDYGFKGWGLGENYKEGQVIEIEYDEKSKYEGTNAIYYQLIQPKDAISHTEMMKKLGELEFKLGQLGNLLQVINIKVSGEIGEDKSGLRPIKDIIGEQEIPVIEESEEGTNLGPEDFQDDADRELDEGSEI